MGFLLAKKRRCAGPVIQRATSGVVVELLEMRRMLSAAPAVRHGVVETDLMKGIALAMARKKAAAAEAVSSGASTSSAGQTSAATKKKSTTSQPVAIKKFKVKIIKAEDYGGGGGSPAAPSAAPTGNTTASGGTNAQSPTSKGGGDPVRLSDGTLNFQVTDLESNAFSSLFGQVRSWTNNPAYVSTISNLGNGWTLGNIPTLVQPLGQWGPQMILENGATADGFTSTFSWYLVKPLPPPADYPDFPYLENLSTNPETPDWIGTNFEYPPNYDGPGPESPNPNNPNYVPPPVQGDIPGKPYTSSYYAATLPAYAPQFNDGDSLTYNSSNDTYTWRDPQGDRYVFDGFNQYPSNEAGRLQTYYSPLGGSTSTFSYNGSGYISEVDRTVPNGSLTETWLYSYLDSGPSDDELGSVTLERESSGSSSPSVIDSVQYQYYDGTTPGGNLNDLEDAIVTDPTRAVLSETYYRYYLPGQANGYQSGLEYAFTPQAFARMLQGVEGVSLDNASLNTAIQDTANLNTATNAQIAPYATQYYQYGSTPIVDYSSPVADAPTATVYPVSFETISGFGSNENGGSGDGSISFQYSTSSNYDPTFDADGESTPNLNVWWYKTVETYGDGSADTVYLNSAGLAILSSHTDAGGDVSSTWNQYDTQGFVTETAEPSAVVSFDQSADDLLDSDSFSQNSGLIYSYTWNDSTGEPIATYHQQGAVGTAVLQESTAYELINIGATSMEVMTSDEVWDGTSTHLTTYRYNTGGATMPLEIITTQTTPTASQNGSPTAVAATTLEFYDPNGNLSWEEDPDGNISYWNYDLATGAVIQSVTNIDKSTFSVPAPAGLGAGNGTGAGANLSTTDEVDDQGNVTEQTDPDGNITYTVYDYPDHSMRVYPGWHPVPGTDTYTTTGPVQVTSEDWADGYTDTLTYAPGALNQAVPYGTDPITNLQTLSRTQTDDAGQTAAADQYFNVSGITYSPDAPLGAAGVNFNQTTYGYNVLGYQNQVTDANGTITQNTYDSLGRLTSTAVGTAAGGLTDVADYAYSNGGTATGDLTQVTLHPGGGAADRVTDYFYDYQDNPIGELENAGTDSEILLFTQYDQLGNPTLSEQFAAGSTVITDADLVNAADKIPSGLTAGDLRAQSTYAWDDQGQLYREQDFSVNPGSGAVAATPSTTNWYYDLDGNVIATQAPSGLWTKDIYNGSGQVIAQYQTGAGAAAGTTWADADSVSGDHVLSQDVYQYDNDGNLITDTTSDRLSTDASGTGEGLGALTSGGSTAARVSEEAWYYDAADRLVESADLGTNIGGFSYNASSPVADSSAALTTTYGYNAAGWASDETDPNGITTQTSYDNAGRVVQTIADYTVVDGVGGTPTDDSNQTTDYTYDGDGNVTSMTAVMPPDSPGATPDQTTQYTYGGSGTDSNDLLSSINYPDPTTGAASTSPSQTETYTYDALGETTGYTDRNGTTHQYSYNTLGQLVSDQVTAFGAGVDQTVSELGYTYNDAGLLQTATSYGPGGSVLNQVQDTYDGFGQLASEAQSHSGAVTDSTPTVGYTYDDSQGDRITSMTYPDGRTLDYNYASGIDDATSQISGLSDSSGTIQSYGYQGLGDPVQMTDGNGVQLNVTQDAFGRTSEQNWSEDGTSIDSESYTYDADGDVLSKTDNVHSANSETYTYDNLDRLTSFTRADGTSESWSLDAAGNQLSTTATTPASAATPAVTTTTTNTLNAQNQLTATSDDAGDSTADTYDKNGNLIRSDNGSTTTTYVYDAWNRPVSATSKADFFSDLEQVLFSATYDALGRRITTLESGGITDLYYDDRGQVIEEQQAGQTTTQYVWSPFYVNQLVERDDEPSSSGVLTRRLYVEQDANYNVTSLTDASGNVVERYVYNPYGTVTVENPDGSVRGDGTLASSDYGIEYLFQGGRIDPQTGLYLFGVRDYDPTTGRWEQQDPAGYVNGANRYQFVVDAPTDLVDPTGLTWSDGWGDAFASLFGEADPQVQNAYDQSNYDRTNGTGDAFGVNGLAGDHTFDQANRDNARQDANDINAAVGAALAPAAALDAAAAAAVEAGADAAVGAEAGEGAAEGEGAAGEGSNGGGDEGNGSGDSNGEKPDGEQEDPTNEGCDGGSGNCFVAGTRVLMAGGYAMAGSAGNGPAGSLFWRHRVGLGAAAAIAGPAGYLLLAGIDRKRRRPEQTEATDGADDGEDSLEPQWVPLLPRSWRDEYRRRIIELVRPELRSLFSLEELGRR
jgi:RHS repeat-associated protein